MPSKTHLHRSCAAGPYDNWAGWGLLLGRFKHYLDQDMTKAGNGWLAPQQLLSLHLPATYLPLFSTFLPLCRAWRPHYQLPPPPLPSWWAWLTTSTIEAGRSVFKHCGIGGRTWAASLIISTENQN